MNHYDGPVFLKNKQRQRQSQQPAPTKKTSLPVRPQSQPRVVPEPGRATSKVTHFTPSYIPPSVQRSRPTEQSRLHQLVAELRQPPVFGITDDTALPLIDLTQPEDSNITEDEQLDQSAATLPQTQAAVQSEDAIQTAPATTAAVVKAPVTASAVPPTSQAVASSATTQVTIGATADHGKMVTSAAKTADSKVATTKAVVADHQVALASAASAQTASSAVATETTSAVAQASVTNVAAKSEPQVSETVTSASNQVQATTPLQQESTGPNWQAVVDSLPVLLANVATPPQGRVATEQPATEQPATEQPATEQPATEQPATEQPATEQPATEQPATEQPATEQPATEQPATEQPATEQPATEQPATEQPATEQPATEQPATEQPATEQPATEQPATEQPATEQPTVAKTTALPQVDESGYHMPPLNLLPDPVMTNSSEMAAWVQHQRTVLNETLNAFNVKAVVSRWSIGPAVTQFELTLSRGVKVNKITNLSDDLKLALAAKDIRIEAPIPGKSTVGIEIPNLKSRPVMLSEVVRSEAFAKSKSPLTIALGVDLFGQPMVTNIAKMPHGLIAGATGSGKSVFINSLLLSILFKAKPSEVKLLLIDPKAVELAPYNGLPHLLSPVISDPKAASAALKWAVEEMEERYQKLAAAGVRNLEQFNHKAESHGDYGLKLPYIVIIIDELADLMMVASTEVQDYIVRITQKARAAGIHLIVATQRPSVDIITGTIKNNIPTRIAFMVSSQIDSRTIIDQGGAERLLGRGDMLYLGNGQSQPVRIQGTYAEKEIDAIVAYVKKQLPPHYLFEPDGLLQQATEQANQDELFPDVLRYLAAEKQISTSKLQREFKIGYNRAASLIDDLEARKFISPASGSKPRDVYFTPDDLIALENR